MVPHDSEHTSPFSYPRGADPQTADTQSYAAPDLDSTANYATLIAAPTYAPYAPSPSLLGTNDPLGRASARVPVISFGFGGKLVSCFHSASDAISGFDVSLTARQSTSVLIRTLHEIIPASAMDSSGASYPGPLFFDPGPPSISLARTVGVGVAGNVKAKKALLLKWLEERADELSSGIPHIPSGSQERNNAEGRLVLARLLKAMVQNDGQLSGSASVEWAVRSALIPRLEAQGSPLSGGSNTELPITSSYGSALTDSNEPPLAHYTLRSSALDRMQEFLLRGERRKAYHYAIDEKLWAHAMLIASSVDTQAWKDVVKEFIHSELGIKQNLSSFAGPKADTTAPTVNGRESLRVAYSLFSGQGALAVQELIPSTTIAANKEASLAPPVPGLHATPISPNFPQPALTASIPSEALEKWQETAAIMAFSQTAGDSAALTALGDYLSANRWFDAAHACYLLSPRTSSFGGLGTPSVRTVLVGCESPATLRNFNKDLDVTIFSEIVEFALSLSPSKNQDAFAGLPHLQAYKLVRASHLAEMGHVEIANRYCEGIGSTIRASTRGSQFYTPTFVGELKNLSDRLTAAPQLDKTASWISRTMSKPSLDTIGSWLEGRFSKLIVGEGEDGAVSPANEPAQPSHQSYGPFSHYSAISSATSSAAPSRSSTPYGAGSLNPGVAAPFNALGSTPIDRAASAMDHLRPERHRASPVPRVASASAATTTFAQAYNPISHYKPALGVVNGTAENDNTTESEGQEVTWWGSHSSDNAGPTPTATTFHEVDERETEGNFISLMDEFSPGPTPMAAKSSQSRVEDDEDLEDLGFSNTATKAKAESATSDTELSDKPTKEAKDEKKSEAAKPGKTIGITSESQQQSTSWLGRWWPRASSSTSPAPIKANLGEETSFYYDKELKRWVNKKAGATPTTPTPPPPPPSRPRTASPAPVGLSPSPNGSSSTPPPPPRAVSAADLTGRKPPRVRSNLVPKEDAAPPGSAPPLATSFNTESSGPAPGPPRTKSAAGKRNVRSRYVDILQQPSAS
ncbi:Sec23-binding domain of Sec16-domain-containing protein [Hysterangium stoloniferum]|nr:Sec23-binding domain of Sec16-domain-containing protein [Hysterangium stoloniferum]